MFTSRVSHGFTARPGVMAFFLAAGGFSLANTAGQNVEVRVSCDRRPVETVAYEGECGAYSCVSVDRMD